MVSSAEIPYVLPSDASDRCRDIVVTIVAALGQVSHGQQEMQDRFLALIAVMAAEIARGGDPDKARERFSMAGKILADLGPRCVERARQLREADKTVN